MSHIEKSQTQMSNEDTIIDAVKRLEQRMGVELVIEKNARPRYWSDGQGKKCDLVVKLPGRFDLGFVKEKDGTYSLSADAYLLNDQYEGQAGAAIIGLEGCELLKEYHAANTIKELESQGYDCIATLHESGVYEIEATERESLIEGYAF